MIVKRLIKNVYEIPHKGILIFFAATISYYAQIV